MGRDNKQPISLWVGPQRWLRKLTTYLEKHKINTRLFLTVEQQRLVAFQADAWLESRC